MTTNQLTRRHVLALAALSATAALGVAGPSATADAATCETDWGSLPKVSGITTDMTGQTIDRVRTGRHACYDRMVIDISGPGEGTAGFSVRYVRTVRGLGSGEAIALRGGAKLEVLVNASQDRWTRAPGGVSGYRTFRQIKSGGSFEGQTLYGLGVRARLPMRAFLMETAEGQKLVIDVAHRW